MPSYTSAAGTFEVNSDLWAEIDGVPLSTPAWSAPNPLALKRKGPMRQSSVMVPRAHGRLPRRMWRDAFDLVLAVQVFGGFDMVGAPTSSEIQGLIDNLEFLDSNVGVIPGTTYSTRTCVLHLPDSSTWSGDVQVLEFAWPDDIENAPAAVNAALTLFIPDGALTEDP